MEHITTLSLELKPENGFERPKAGVCSLGPMLQSVLMERADPAYAEQLHASSFNPYSQYCFESNDGGIVWRICALTDEAAQLLLEPVRAIESFKLRNLGKTFAVAKTTCETVSLAHVLAALEQGTDATFRIRFASPTAFKSKGQYVIMPDIRLIFQNLLMHYNQVYAGDNEIDDDTISYIVAHTRITSYNLRSHYFPRTMGGTDKIPAFVGGLALHVSGPQSLKGLVSMLLTFGVASGVGIKTSMGMGGVLCARSASNVKPVEQGGSVGR